MSDELWVETVEDPTGDYGSFERRWETQPPARGSTFKIIRQTWLDEAGLSVQIIHEWRPGSLVGEP